MGKDTQKILENLFKFYKNTYRYMKVRTKDSPKTLLFYEKCGFIKDHVVSNFFLDHYDHLIIEDEVLLKDMIYLKKYL